MCFDNSKCILEVARKALHNKDYLSAYFVYKIFEKRCPEIKKSISVNIEKIEKRFHSHMKEDYKPTIDHDFASINIGKYAKFIKLLWNGYSNIAICEIKKILASTDITVMQKNKIKYSLFNFYYAMKDYESAADTLDNIEFASSDIVLLKIITNMRLNYIEKARHLYDMLPEKTKNSSMGMFINSSLQGNDKDRLYFINAALEKYNLSKLDMVDLTKDLSFSNISSTVHSSYEHCDYKVSIIVPAYNAEATIETSIRGLLFQTWKNIEIIVVDDNSSDNTVEIVKKLCATDSRIRLLPQKKNQGCYSSRNIGVLCATGDFITVHDADDWSHPQKIAIQVTELLAKPENVGNYSYCILMDKLLYVKGAYTPFPLFRMNYSSFLFRRNIIGTVGVWDSVRFAGDAEYIERIRKKYGKKSVEPVSLPIPLSFILSSEDSLTRSKGTSLASLKFFNSPRYMYRQFFIYKHDLKNGEDVKLSIRSLKKYKKEYYDFVLVADFSVSDENLSSIIESLKSLSNGKYSVAVLHWLRCDSKLLDINHKIFEVCSDYHIDILTISDSVKVKSLIFYHDMIVTCIPDSLPNILPENIFIVCCQYYKEAVNSNAMIYNPEKIEHAVFDMFKKLAIWIPISDHIKNIITKDEMYSRVSYEIWPKLFNKDHITTKSKRKVRRT